MEALTKNKKPLAIFLALVVVASVYYALSSEPASIILDSSVVSFVSPDDTVDYYVGDVIDVTIIFDPAKGVVSGVTVISLSYKITVDIGTGESIMAERVDFDLGGPFVKTVTYTLVDNGTTTFRGYLDLQSDLNMTRFYNLLDITVFSYPGQIETTEAVETTEVIMKAPMPTIGFEFLSIIAIPLLILSQRRFKVEKEK